MAVSISRTEKPGIVSISVDTPPPGGVPLLFEVSDLQLELLTELLFVWRSKDRVASGVCSIEFHDDWSYVIEGTIEEDEVLSGGGDIEGEQEEENPYSIG